MSFNLNNTPDRVKPTSGSTTSYTKPGVHENVVITEVVKLESSKNQIPYMQLRTKDSTGAIGKSVNMWFSTDLKPGNKMTGWDVTSRNIEDFIMATHNVDKNKAREMFGNNPTQEDVINKVASLLIGKPFRGKFKGETNYEGKVYASLATIESMQVPVERTGLRFDPKYDIKEYTPYVPQSENQPVDVVNTSTDDKDDLPF